MADGVKLSPFFNRIMALPMGVLKCFSNLSIPTATFGVLFAYSNCTSRSNSQTFLLERIWKTSNRNIAKKEMQIHRGVKEFRTSPSQDCPVHISLGTKVNEEKGLHFYEIQALYDEILKTS